MLGKEPVGVSGREGMNLVGHTRFFVPICLVGHTHLSACPTPCFPLTIAGTDPRRPISKKYLLQAVPSPPPPYHLLAWHGMAAC